MIKQKNQSPSYLTLNKLGVAIDVSIRYSIRAKRILIRVHGQGIELVLPRRKSLTLGKQFLLDKEAWVRQKLQLKHETRSETKGNIIPIYDKKYSLSYINSNHADVQVTNTEIQVYAVPNSHTQVLIRFLQNKLFVEITEIINLLNKQLKLFIQSITITSSKTKWGSCSSKAVLSFNWRLIFVPIEIVRYVIVHEMCHLVEMNHSKAFWILVSNLCPDWKEARLWLKKNSFRLHLYLTDMD